MDTNNKIYIGRLPVFINVCQIAKGAFTPCGTNVCELVRSSVALAVVCCDEACCDVSFARVGFDFADRNRMLTLLSEQTEIHLPQISVRRDGPWPSRALAGFGDVLVGKADESGIVGSLVDRPRARKSDNATGNFGTGRRAFKARHAAPQLKGSLVTSSLGISLFIGVKRLMREVPVSPPNSETPEAPQLVLRDFEGTVVVDIGLGRGLLLNIRHILEVHVRGTSSEFLEELASIEVLVSTSYSLHVS